MSTDKWMDWLINGGDMPTIETEEVDLPDGVFVCMQCGKINNYWHMNCEACEDPLGGDGPDD